jgi:hypothetical protein
MWTSCTLETSSHTLSPGAFSVLERSEANTRIRVLSETELLISVRHIGPDTDTPIQKLHHAHQVIRTFVIGFNVASLGYFYWQNAPWLHPVLSISSDLEGSDRTESTLMAEPVHAFESRSALSSQIVQNAILIFGIFAKEPSIALGTEYTKGILLLRMQFCDVHSRTEAFMCFYRALEYFIASRVLKVRKLTNELKDMQRGLAIVGLDGEILDEFREIYVIRSSQAAHTQIQPRELTFDEVMKTKVFLDFVIHKTFVAQGHALMQARADA